MEIKDCEEGKIYFRKSGVYEYFWEYGNKNNYIATTRIKLISYAPFTAYPKIDIIREATPLEIICFNRCLDLKTVLPFKHILNLYGLINK